MKKKATSPKKRGRAEDSTTITISIKKDLLAKIDAAAKEVLRSRSNFIITHMMRTVSKQSDRD